LTRNSLASTKFCKSTSSPGTGHSHWRRKRRKGRRKKREPVQLLVALVGEGEGAGEAVEDEAVGIAGTPLLETEHGRIRTKPAVAITIGNAAMTRRWPVLRNPRFDIVCPPNPCLCTMQILRTGVSQFT
jgi:hypothetical protein